MAGVSLKVELRSRNLHYTPYLETGGSALVGREIEGKLHAFQVQGI